MGLPVTYANDGNAAALYAHQVQFGALAPERSSISAIVGTGLGGGVVQEGRVIEGAAGMAGEVGHVFVPTADLLEKDQPLPGCNCGFSGDAESIASLTGIRRNLLPFWLQRFPDHPLHDVDPAEAAKQVRGYGERGDEMALAVFAQQARAIGALGPEKYAKMVAFLKSPACHRVRTNNHVERVNRKLRYEEKARYRWRSRRTTVRFLVLLLDRCWKQERAIRNRWREESQPEARSRSSPKTAAMDRVA